ncbi:DUF317 domain-containing protein [Streptomyces sp. NPDC007896]|uniref:DUF317 domain-containing protein n=1 Tax=Streptomyces sp. NPDC007896 TaxID=3364784 RepID=UPI0036E76D1E
MTPAPPIDAHVRLDTHPTHPSAVIAVLTGSQASITHTGLEAAGWTVVAENVLVLVRIDHEEPYWAKDAATHLAAEGTTVEITPRLQEAMDEEWTWASYPMSWCTRSEIREVSNAAQKIHDDIRHGRLLIHAHADDGHTAVAVGTYLGRNGKSVYLYGEDHLRQIADTFDSPAQALVAFEKVHAADMRPGPAPLTDTERAAAEARAPLALTAAKPEPAHPEPETVPAYAADAGDHDALLDAFLDAHGDWERWRTWDDDSTVANHESLTLRALFDHEAQGRDTKWTLAAYETPVSERLWHATVAASTPAEIVLAVLNSAAGESAWGPAASLTETTITQATRPLADAGWKQTIEGHYIRWEAPGEEAAGIQFDAFAAGQRPSSALPTWTVWGGNAVHQPTWALELSAHFPTPLLQDIAFELAGGHGIRTVRPAPPEGPALRTVQAGVSPAPPAPRLSNRGR